VTPQKALSLAKWWLGPLVVAALAGELGSFHAKQQRGEFFAQTSALSERELARLKSVPARVMDNAAWTLANAEQARQLLKFELDRLAEVEGARRARVLIRFGLVDSNFDGQAAVFSQACVADASVCDPPGLKDAASKETKDRFVPPGNHLPVSLLGGHPPIPGPF
jgi:hypothetical protein